LTNFISPKGEEKNMSTKKENSEKETIQKIRTVNINRRGFLRFTGTGAAAIASGLIAGCAPTAPQEPSAESAGEEQEAPAEAPTEVPDGKQVLAIGQWGGDWLETLKAEIVEPFEQEYDCVVEIDTAWPFWPKMAAAPVDAPPLDVINDNLPHAFRMQDAGLLFSPQEVKQNVPNAANLWDFAFEGTGVIHAWSPYGIGYRADLVDPVPTSYADLFSARFNDKRGTYTMPNTLGAALVMIAGKIFGADEYDYEAGLQALAEAAPWKLAEFTTQMTGLLERGEIEVANIHDSDIYQQADQGLPFDWTTADDAPVGVLAQNLSIAKNTKNPDLAFAFVDYFLNPARHLALTGQFYMRPANKTEEVSEAMAARGVKNSADEIDNLWVFDWNWWNEHEEEIVERYNEIIQG
jgi:putative spermidine/putrescine transport system substrate-binding protein